MDFNQKAAMWDLDPQRIERAAKFANEMKNALGGKKLRKVLEFGSGTGLVSFQLKDEFNSIYLADTSEGMTNILKGKIEADGIRNMTPLLIIDTSDLNVLEGIEAIYTLLTLHHVKDLDNTFKVFSSILPAGGRLFIGDLITEDGSFHFRDPEFDGHLGFDTAKLKASLALRGFECVNDKIFTIIEREHEGKVKKYPLFFLDLVKK
ncbi:MAG: methyltransferase domain-containing protein [Bacteroidales bacterium]